MTEEESGGLVEKVRGMVNVRRKVEKSTGKTSYPYTVETIDNIELAKFFNREQHADKLFLLNFAAKSKPNIALLKDLQVLGFDLYAMMSSLKRDEISPIHGDRTLFFTMKLELGCSYFNFAVSL